MKKWMPLVLTVSFVLFTITKTSSQEKTMPSASERAARQTEWMKTNLHLTSEQEAKVQEINLKYANKMEELKTVTGTKKNKMMAAKKEQDAKDAELQSVLNENQFNTYLAKKNEMKEKFKEKRKENKQG